MLNIPSLVTPRKSEINASKVNLIKKYSNPQMLDCYQVTWMDGWMDGDMDTQTASGGLPHLKTVTEVDYRNQPNFQSYFSL